MVLLDTDTPITGLVPRLICDITFIKTETYFPFYVAIVIDFENLYLYRQTGIS